MITVVCLSPSLDQTILLPGLAVGGTNRAQGKRTAAGGKGVNVAMTLAAMGERVRLVLPRHERGAGKLFAALDAAGIDCVAVDTPGELRVNLKLMDTRTDTVTEVNASAEPVPPEVLARLEEAIAASAAQSRWLVLTGSLPSGCAADTYARIIRRVRAHSPACRIALDADGEPLRAGVQAQPDLIKPNRHELEQLVGRACASQDALIGEAKALAAQGVRAALVTLDKAGSLLVTAEGVYRADAVSVPVATTVGAGDAMLSGYLHAHAQGMQAALAYGAACAAARVAGRDGEAEAYLPQVRTERIG